MPSIFKFDIFLEAQLPGTTQDHLQIFNIELKAKIKSHQMPEQVTGVHEPSHNYIMFWSLLISIEVSLSKDEQSPLLCV